MRLDCPRCGHVLEYAHLAPRFCSNCGQPLSSHAPGPTISLETTSEGRPDHQHTPDPLGITPHAQVTVSYPGPPPSALHARPDVVGDYRLLRSLGAGGMGTVYEAEEIPTGRRFALKLIRPEFAESRDTVERFRREGRLAGTILHPRCVFVHAADEEDGKPFIVMELMPGQTLADRVEKQGPLPIREAVSQILDVIEGLEEAHRTGVIHRDVKPSNCFLDSDGRVKVGDFGLAKSCLTAEQLTRSGGFLGTVLYAAPEQIRNDNVNHLADVYSVCATLYYLLTGRAPFDDVDPAVALARAVTEPVPSARKIRPDIPRTLDEVLLTGLARSRSKRWQSLEGLRLALLPFLDPPVPPSTVLWRVSAYLCDLLLIIPIEVGVQRLAIWLPVHPTTGTGTLLLSMVVSLVCGLFYFGLPEWRWGYSPGKWLMGLRVRDARTGDRPGLGQASLRTLWFVLFKGMTAQGIGLPLWLVGAQLFGGAGIPRVIGGVLVVASLPFLSGGMGLALLASTMRRRNGYRGIHELLSGTRVIPLPTARQRLRVASRKLGQVGVFPAGVPTEIGCFTVRACVMIGPDEQLLTGEDTFLNRPVWLWRRKSQERKLDAQPTFVELPASRRDLTRASRPRWLAAGEEEGWHWDAFVLNPGCLLAGLVSRKRRLGWLDTLSLLDQLAAELDAASKDGTLPVNLSAEQVWVQPGGRLLLLDFAPSPPRLVTSPIDLLRQTAALALEGVSRKAADLDRPIHAPIPGHASELLDCLMAGGFANLTEIHQAFTAAHELPEEISPPGRGFQVGLVALGLFSGLLFMFALGPVFLLAAYAVCVRAEAVQNLQQVQLTVEDEAEMVEHLEQLARLEEERALLRRDRDAILASWSWFVRNHLTAIEQQYTRDVTAEEIPGGASGLAREVLSDTWLLLLMLAFWPLTWSLWGAMSRGGISLRLAGITLVGADGRPAARWRCAWRTLVVWLPVALILFLSLWLDASRIAYARDGWSAEEINWSAWVSWYAWWLALILTASYVLAAVIWPNRQLHDYLSGTYPVPR